jgi:hypothetical protein
VRRWLRARRQPARVAAPGYEVWSPPPGLYLTVDRAFRAAKRDPTGEAASRFRRRRRPSCTASPARRCRLRRPRRDVPRGRRGRATRNRGDLSRCGLVSVLLRRLSSGRSADLTDLHSCASRGRTTDALEACVVVGGTSWTRSDDDAPVPGAACGRSPEAPQANRSPWPDATGPVASNEIEVVRIAFLRRLRVAGPARASDAGGGCAAPGRCRRASARVARCLPELRQLARSTPDRTRLCLNRRHKIVVGTRMAADLPTEAAVEV